MPIQPALTDLPSKQKFDPGDRVIVSTLTIDADRVKQFERSVSKWARVPLRVLVVDISKVSVYVRRGVNVEVVASAHDTKTKTPLPGVVNVRCGKVVLAPGDAVGVIGLQNLTEVPRRRFVERLREWVGNDYEIIEG